ncbi:MAG: rRNA maturation RNase YbeY [Myxococcota bacterium]
MKLEVHFSGQSLLPPPQRAWILKKIRALKLLNEERDLQVSVQFVSDAEMQALNMTWRGKDQSTDVLSFSAQEGEAMPGLEDILGDVVISVERAQAQALEFAHELQEEIVVLFVHGLMHLLGHDHELSKTDADKQAEAESQLLLQIGLRPELALCGRA